MRLNVILSILLIPFIGFCEIYQGSDQSSIYISSINTNYKAKAIYQGKTLISNPNGKNYPKYNISAKDYVQDGLVFMLDGIENAGWGTHSDNTNVWIELVSGSSIGISAYQGYEWEALGFRSDENHQYMYTTVTVNSSSNGTAEVCYSDADYSKSLAAGNFGAFSMFRLGPYFGSWGIAYYNGTSGTLLKWGFSRTDPWNYNIEAGLIDEGVFVTTMTASSVDSNKVGYVYKNGVAVKSGLDFNNTDPIVEHNTHFMRSNYGENLAAYYHSWRIYNRPLTPAEVAHNYAVDKARFGL